VRIELFWPGRAGDVSAPSIGGIVSVGTQAPAAHWARMRQLLTSPAETGQANRLEARRNVKATIRHAAVMVLAGALASSCVQKEEKKEEPAPVIKALPPAPTPPPEPARSALILSPTATYNITTAGGNKCVQFVGAVATDGAQAEIRTCNGSKAQQFTLQAIPGGYQTIINAVTKKCLDVAKLSPDDGAAVEQWECNGGLNQQWIVADGGPGTIRLVARHSGKVLDAKDNQADDGTRLIQYTWKSGLNQQFQLKVVAPEATDGSGKGGQAKKADKAKTDKSKKTGKSK
jgi:hypothetical protein